MQGKTKQTAKRRAAGPINSGCFIRIELTALCFIFSLSSTLSLKNQPGYGLMIQATSQPNHTHDNQ